MGLWINYRCYAIWCYNMPCARSFTQNLRPARVLCPKLFRDDRRDLTFFGDHYSTLWPSTMLRCYNVTSLSLNPWVYMSTGSTVYSDEPPEDGDFVARKWWNPRKDMLKIGDFWWITVCLHQILATSLCWVNCIANCFVTYYGATRPFLNLLVHNHLIQRRKSLMDSYVESSP